MKKIDRMYSELSRGIEAENKNPHYTQLKTGEEILSLQAQSYGDGEDCNGGEGLIWIGLVDKSVTLVKYGIQMGLSAGGGPTTVLENMYNVKLTGVPSCIATEVRKIKNTITGVMTGDVRSEALSYSLFPQLTRSLRSRAGWEGLFWVF